MVLKLEHDWVWDFWFARDGRDWHVFYLRAPKSLVDPDLRHRNATIGHAQSNDLVRWEVMPDPFPLGPVGSWDDLATWTGSVVRSRETWWMFYTGVSTVDDGKIQRIGAAVSRDLSVWDKVPSNPICVSEPRWYESYEPESWYEEVWRDPWVFADPNGGGFHMYVTARVATGQAATRGVIGHATSDDLLNWDAHPPVTEPGVYGHMEVPQQVSIGGRHYLLFCVPDWAQPGVGNALTGTGYLVADSPLGPYRPGPTPFVSADRRGSLYAGKLVETDDGYVFIATEHNGTGGRYVGQISDPMPVVVAEDGGLLLATAER